MSIEQDVKNWLADEGVFREKAADENADFHFVIEFPKDNITILKEAKRFDTKYQNYIYNIKPIYNNKNLYKINLNCIIEIKMVHIINIIYMLLKKGRKKNECSTTSNRKPYAYSYEQH